MSLDRKVAIVDLTTGKIDIKPIPLEVRKQFLGGRGLAAYLLYKHSKPGCDPLSPDNAVIFSAGILGGMCARVCPTETLCEEACVREAAEGKPVEIGRLQRHATDSLMAKGIHPFERAARARVGGRFARGSRTW